MPSDRPPGLVQAESQGGQGSLTHRRAVTLLSTLKRSTFPSHTHPTGVRPLHRQRPPIQNTQLEHARALGQQRFQPDSASWGVSVFICEFGACLSNHHRVSPSPEAFHWSLGPNTVHEAKMKKTMAPSLRELTTDGQRERNKETKPEMHHTVPDRTKPLRQLQG